MLSNDFMKVEVYYTVISTVLRDFTLFIFLLLLIGETLSSFSDSTDLYSDLLAGTMKK